MAEGDSLTIDEVVARALGGELGDFLRAAVAVVAREIMEGEVSAERGEVSESRVTHRDGHRPRVWKTRVGEVELAIPPKCSGPCISRRSRAASALGAGDRGGRAGGERHETPHDRPCHRHRLRRRARRRVVPAAARAATPAKLPHGTRRILGRSPEGDLQAGVRRVDPARAGGGCDDHAGVPRARAPPPAARRAAAAPVPVGDAVLEAIEQRATALGVNVDRASSAGAPTATRCGASSTRSTLTASSSPPRQLTRRAVKQRPRMAAGEGARRGHDPAPDPEDHRKVTADASPGTSEAVAGTSSRTLLRTAGQAMSGAGRTEIPSTARPARLSGRGRPAAQGRSTADVRQLGNESCRRGPSSSPVAQAPHAGAGGRPRRSRRPRRGSPFGFGSRR